jgi:hypothetical protein
VGGFINRDLKYELERKLQDLKTR